MRYIFALTLSTFAICTSEFVIVGLLPEIALDLQVSIPKAGTLVSAYAIGVMAGGPILAALTSKMDRKRALMGLIILFIIGNLLCAISPNYNLLLVARIIAALCHGTFFGIASVVASDLSKPHNRGKAIAYVFMGATLANMMGVPIGMAIGLAFGWRASFWAVVMIGITAIVMLKIFLPKDIPIHSNSPFKEFKSLADKRIIIPLTLSALASTSLFTVVTYISPMLRDVTGIEPSKVTIVLLIFGVGLTIGSILGGKLAGINILKSIIGISFIVVLALIVFHFTMPYKYGATATIFMWSIGAFALCPMLQLLVLQNAGAAPNLASTFNQSAFHLGNAIGAKLGGVLISMQFLLIELPIAGAIVTMLALAITVYFTLAMRREKRSQVL